MKRFQTSLMRLLNIEPPITQAPIGSSAIPGLTAVTSNAGGLGTLMVNYWVLERVRQIIREARELTGRPFGANLIRHIPTDELDAISLSAWNKAFQSSASSRTILRRTLNWR